MHSSDLDKKAAFIVKNKYPDKLLRIEVEKENSHAVYVYEKSGFKRLPYYEYYY